MVYPKTLLGKVATKPNLLKAWKAVYLSARNSSNIKTKREVENISPNINSYINKLREELLDSTYEFSVAQEVQISKGHGKKRPIIIPIIRDRIVQKAMALKLEEILSKEFDLKNNASFAYIKGRGVQSAICKMLEYYQEGCIFALEADIKEFFTNVNINRVVEVVRPKLPDRTLDSLLESALQMEINHIAPPIDIDEDLLPERTTGLPQGGYLSPLLSNVYLYPFDKQMTDLGYRLIRYADDFVVMCKSKFEAEEAYKQAAEILKQINLELHDRNDASKDSKTRVVQISQKPISYLGCKFNGKLLILEGSKKQVFTKKLTERVNKATDVTELLISTDNLVKGWIASYAYLDLNNTIITKIDQEINKQIYRKLKKFSWNFSSEGFTNTHRQYSGVTFAANHLSKVRGSLKNYETFRKYWTSL